MFKNKYIIFLWFYLYFHPNSSYLQIFYFKVNTHLDLGFKLISSTALNIKNLLKLAQTTLVRLDIQSFLGFIFIFFLQTQRKHGNNRFYPEMMAVFP